MKTCKKLRTPHPVVFLLKSAALIVAGFAACQAVAGAADADTLWGAPDGKQEIIKKFKSLLPEINNNKDHFVIGAKVSDGNAAGEVYGVLPYPMHSLATVLTSTKHWCNATIIHINIKACTTNHPAKGSPVVTLYVGDEDYTEPELAEKIQYRFKVHTNNSDYIHITLSANTGPIDTGSSSIDIKAVKLDDKNSLVSLDYSMYIGTFTRALLKTYLSTLGRNKVGFTETDDSTALTPKYIGGIPGVMERNTMRYYFAFDAYLATLQEPENNQFPAALNHWFNYTEKYKKQLYEIDRLEYIKRKNKEKQNQLLLQAKKSDSIP